MQDLESCLGWYSYSAPQEAESKGGSTGQMDKCKHGLEPEQGPVEGKSFGFPKSWMGSKKIWRALQLLCPDYK